MRPLGGGGWGACALATAALTATLSACGNTDSRLSTGDPLHYLITIDQLITPDFTVSTAAAHVDASTLAGGDSAVAAALAANGLESAARVEYQRADDFSTSNGPLDVVATVERFATVAGATGAYGAAVHALDAMPNATPTSTGPLGDAAHAISVVKPTAGGLPAVEITVEWRVGNLLDTIITRGRYGGTRLDDALALAGRQTANESGSSS
jgi:hypothetical protein